MSTPDDLFERSLSARRIPRDLWVAGTLLAFQLVVAAYFIVDAVADRREAGGAGAEATLELLVAIALLAGVLLGAVQLRAILARMRRDAQALAIARGALSEVIAQRFADWRLTPAEADVALLSLKGLAPADIAAARHAAPATVRVQLSNAYAKAGVDSHAGFTALFLDELLDIDEHVRTR